MHINMNQLNNNQPVAVIPRRSRRLATIIPASHWISMGYSQDDAQRMENLQQDMKTICDGVNEIEIGLDGGGREALPHHDMLLPHWQKLAKGLKGRTKVEEIKIYGVSLPVSVLDIIFPTIHSMNLETLSIYKTGFGNEEYLGLSSFFKQNTSLVKLFLGGDAIDDISVASELSDAIKNHPNIGLLAFNKCGLSSNPGILETILEGCTRIMLVSVANEKLGMEGVALLARFIRSNHPTEILSFRDNKFTDDDMLVLASALRFNTNLERLILQDNNFTDEGDKTLLKALYDPTSMDSIVESNHTCIAYTWDIKSSWLVLQRPPDETEVFNINADDEISIQQKIRKKVVLALCGVDGGLFDLSHLNDLPLAVMPRVLELIQEHSEARTREFRRMPVPNEILDSMSLSFEQYQRKLLEKDALSRLFHTLRGWELPLLFENLHNPSSNVSTGKRKRRKTRR